MLRSLYVMLDYHLDATDGTQGIVWDFLFDDESWIIHYLVAEVATPLGPRKVLILPFAVGTPDWENKRVPVALTGEQIRTSPPLEADLPISRQYETGLKRPGSHLRSMRELLGYSMHTTDGEAGHVEDLIIEDTLWGVHHAVIALRRSSRSILLAPESIRSISWSGKACWANLSLQEISSHAEFDPAQPVNHDEQNEHLLYDYYGRPVNPPPPFKAGGRPEVQR